MMFVEDIRCSMNTALTRATDELRRRAFTVEDLRRMVDAGVIAEDERIELVQGEIVVMAAKGYAHEVIKSALMRAIVRVLPDDVEIGVETSIQFARDMLLEPDIALFPRRDRRKSDAGFVTADPGSWLLVIEVAASSLGYDRGAKARLYAALGVRESWVIDANERSAWIHSGPSRDGWSSVVERGPTQELTTPAVAGFSIRLGAAE